MVNYSPQPSMAASTSPYAGSDPYLSSTRTNSTVYSEPGWGTRPQAPRKSNNRDFVAAGLCVFAGALILVFVYFMALALSLPSTSPTNGTTITATPYNTVNAPTAVAATPSVNGNPGAQYIDNPQMASAVNFNTAQPLLTTTTFKPNQKIYVTFNIHPAGRDGAVCLYWYLNTKYVAQYPFAVTLNDKAGYSYAIYGGAGLAYVEIYWASTTACSDKILAQQVNFRVTA